MEISLSYLFKAAFMVVSGGFAAFVLWSFAVGIFLALVSKK